MVGSVVGLAVGLAGWLGVALKLSLAGVVDVVVSFMVKLAVDVMVALGFVVRVADVVVVGAKVKLADVPTVEWYSFLSTSEIQTCWVTNEYTKTNDGIIYDDHFGAVLVESQPCRDCDEGYKRTKFKNAAMARRYVEIKIHCVAIEQALIEELRGEK